MQTKGVKSRSSPLFMIHVPMPFFTAAILSILLRAVLRLGHRIKSFPGSE